MLLDDQEEVRWLGWMLVPAMPLCMSIVSMGFNSSCMGTGSRIGGRLRRPGAGRPATASSSNPTNRKCLFIILLFSIS
ncbi:MAG: hypothetical protein UZ16_OP3001000365 [Candidatus Hinthialibacteria bacterium OLB16]|nr:MAG: hypothetical protein UZ16_OP3001000365 [Candidatus Hinthialibacteria bacterium OLB16]